MDLSSQFYLTSEHVKQGTSRGEASFGQLSDLNPYVRVSLHKEHVLTDEVCSKFGLIVACNVSKLEAERLNACARAYGNGFVRGECRGAIASMFVDFGDQFVIRDTDGRDKEQYIITGISRSNPAVVTVLAEDEKPLARFLDDDNTIELLEIQGMTQVNGLQSRIKILNKFSLELLDVDARAFDVYKTGGIIKR